MISYGTDASNRYSSCLKALLFSIFRSLGRIRLDPFVGFFIW
ncbi:hypothetical protein SynA15127_01194 [Synechococcus sp. A15-127]|nr:hypothetical protein SynA15127_01194 [Synechococcus sp. A15-127]